MSKASNHSYLSCLMKIKAVIFDLDGTLANTLPLCIQAFRQSVEPLLNRSISDEEIVATFGPSEEGTIMALAPDHYDQGVSDYLQHYENLHELCPAPFDGIRELLEMLKSKKVHIAMVTGKGVHSTEISLKRFNLLHFFELVETGVPSGPRKAEGIQTILNSFADIRKEEVIYVGDAPGDILASRAAGVPVVAAAWAPTAVPEELIALKPDQLFHTLTDFHNWLSEQL